jgi:phage-related protein
MKIISLGIILFTITACSVPSTTVRSVDSRPSIAIKGARPGALLFVDGLDMGKAEAYDGNPNILTIESGTHKISIIENGKVIQEQNIFVESELKTISVH